MAITVHTGSTGGQVGTQICVDSSGNSWILYRCYESSAYVLRLYKVTSGGTVTLESGPLNAAAVHGSGTSVGQHGMWIDSADDLHVACLAIPAAQTRDLAYNKYDTGTSSWGSWIEINSHKSGHTGCRITVKGNSSDEIWVYFGYNPNDYAVAYYVNNVGGSWNSAVNVAGTGKADGHHWGRGMEIDENDYVHFYYWRESVAYPKTYQWGYRQFTTSLQTAVEEGPFDTDHSIGQASIWDGTYAWNFGYDSVTTDLIYKLTSANHVHDTTLDLEAFPHAMSYMDDQLVGIFKSTGSSYIELWRDDATEGWTKERNISNGVASAYGFIAYQYWNANYTAPHVCWLQDNVNYFEIIAGDPAGSTTVAFARAGGRPTSDTPAFTRGRDLYSERPAFLYGGYDVGGNTRDAIHASMYGKPSAISAFTAGSFNYYYDVVQFNAYGSASTQDITGDLGGKQPKLVFFMGAGFTANDTITADMAWFFGMTDGVTNMWEGAQRDDNDSGSSYCGNGTTSTVRCAGFYYNSGGSAAFNSWLTNGVQINWTTAAATSFKCVALLVACDDNSQIETATGSFAPNDAAEDEEYKIEGLGFKPDYIQFFVRQGGAGMGLGGAWRDENDDVVQAGSAMDWNSGYFNWWGMCSDKDDRVIADGVTSNQSPAVGIYAVKSFDEDGFTMICTNGDGSYDGPDSYWFAFKLGVTGKCKFVGESISQGPGLVAFDAGCTPDAFLHFGTYGAYCDYPANFSRGDFLLGMGDTGSEWSAYLYDPGQLGNTPYMAKSWGSTAKCITWQGGKQATIDSMDAGSMVLNYSVAGGGGFNYLIFGQGIEATPSQQKAYMTAHSRFRNGYTHGQEHPTSSTSAFFNVVDAMTEIPCYMQGLNPFRGDTPAFMMGVDNPLIIMSPIQLDTASGNQTFTDTRLNGLTPKAAIIWIFGTIGNEGRKDGRAIHGQGFTDGTIEFSQTAHVQDDTTASYDSSLGFTEHCISLVGWQNWVPAWKGRGSFQAWVTNGMTINFDTAPPEPVEGMIMFFAGSELSVDAGKTAIATGTGDTDITDPGWEPDFLCCNFTGATIPYLDTDGSMNFAWAINDEDSPRPSQQHHEHYVGDGTLAGCMHPNFWESLSGQFTDHITLNAYLYVKEFLSTGFRMYRNSQPYSGANLYWLAIKLDTIGRRKATLHRGNNVENTDPLAPPEVVMRRTGTYDLAARPRGGYHIVPENVIVDVMFSDYNTYAGFGYQAYQWRDQELGFNRSFLGGGTRVQFSAINNADWWDCNTQYYDQRSASAKWTENNFVWSSRHETEHVWYDWLKGNFDFIRNGVRLEVDEYDADGDPWDGQDEQHGSSPLVFVIGLAEYYDSRHAYMHGEKVDWPSRTPRGCYLEGAMSLQTSSAPAFMQVGPAGFMPCYLNGFVEGKSTNAAFLHGVDTDLDKKPAFLWGQVLIIDDIPAYTVGQDTLTSFQEAFIWGMNTDLDDAFAFLVGSLDTSSSISAWCRSGTETEDNTPAFLEGAASRGSIFAYTNGYSASPTSSTTAFTTGGGPWPFTEDYTGADEDPWDAGKWLSTDEL
jgi:hypothetical protein